MAKDGGAAFPHHTQATVAHKQRDGVWHTDHGGMSLRDYFAAQALAGISARHDCEYAQTFAMRAYEIADAMLKLRDQKG